MRFRTLIIAGLLALLALPAVAQNAPTNSVSFNGIGFSFDSSLAAHVSITQFSGDPPDMEQPGGPEVNHTEFVLYWNPTDAGSPPANFDAPVVVRAYPVANFDGYDIATRELQRLQALLVDRPDPAGFMTATDDGINPNVLPFMPTANAAQVVRARVAYVQTPQVSGVAYVTAYRQDVSPFMAADFRYTFQGLSADGQYYVSVVALLNAWMFPASVDTTNLADLSADYNGYINQSIQTLNNARADDFSPSLTLLDSLVQSINISGAAPVPLAPTPVPQSPAPTQVDPTLGGLAGTWQLASYGPDHSIPALVQPPVTLIFAANGISGLLGCNQFGGSFQFENNTVHFSNLASTVMACEPAEVMQQETAFINALQTAQAYEIAGGTLTIHYDGGELVLNKTGA